MTIEDPTRIDIIATRPDSPIVRLIIADHLEWTDLRAHSLLIQEKVNAYLAFVESGQLARTTEPPIPDDARVQIELAAKYAPPHEARSFLIQVEEFLHSFGIRFVVVEK